MYQYQEQISEYEELGSSLDGLSSIKNDELIKENIALEMLVKENEKESVPAEGAGKARMAIYEERRLRGLEQFEKEVIQYAKKADQMDIEYRRYKDSCMNQSTYVYSYGRSWFSVWDGYTYINNESLPECKKIWSDFVRLTEEIKAGMIYSMELARKAGVYPGQVRKVREKYYLDWEGWEED